MFLRVFRFLFSWVGGYAVMQLCLVVFFCSSTRNQWVFSRAKDSGCMNCAVEAPHQLWEAEFEAKNIRFHG